MLPKTNYLAFEVLKANNNRISTIHTCIGDCNALTEVDVSSNLLSKLPETMGSLQNLKSLYLSNNELRALPSALFKMLLQLTTLDLHNTEITADVLRQIEGWESFYERRRLKHQKQLDFRAVNSGAFNEGADKSCELMLLISGLHVAIVQSCCPYSVTFVSRFTKASSDLMSMVLELL